MITPGSHDNHPNDEFDTPWKEIVRLYFRDFLAFFLPQAHAGIDWERGVEFLDKELGRITREAEVGDRRMDALVKVWRLDGAECWVLIHVEIQGNRKSDFTAGMYIYQYRAYDLYRKPVVGLAILADDANNWRPAEFVYELWGTRQSYQFTAVKLLDFPEVELEKSTNPFAVVVLAHRQAKRTKNRTEDRFQAKRLLLRSLYKKGFNRQQIIDLFRFIDWVLHLPEEADRRLWKEMVDFEEILKMPYISSVERFGEERGRLQGYQEGQKIGQKAGQKIGQKIGQKAGQKVGEAKILTRQLQRRFGDLPTWASKKIAQAKPHSLEEWSLRILDAQSLEDVLSDKV